MTEEEWEHYRDSDGKSGGQKEKLAYTILAASFAYQFGLEWGAEKSRDFRFAVIDEASAGGPTCRPGMPSSSSPGSVCNC